MLVWAMLKHEKSVSRNVSHKKKNAHIYISVVTELAKYRDISDYGFSRPSIVS